jgi:hypothetical protein
LGHDVPPAKQTPDRCGKDILFQKLTVAWATAGAGHAMKCTQERHELRDGHGPGPPDLFGVLHHSALARATSFAFLLLNRFSMFA